MNPRHFLPILPLAFAGSAASAQPAATSFNEAFTGGKLSANARLRYETVEQDTLRDADSLTARLRLGYTTKDYHGFQAMIEGESVSQLAGDSFDGTGVNTTPPTAAIADPENHEINQTWLAYTREDTTARVGRQRLNFDNARFIGDVGWRQNQQTFDAVFLQNQSVQDLALSYAYLSRVNRVFDDSAPQYDWASDSHLLNASYSGCAWGSLTGYAYLLDFDKLAQGPNAFNNSSQTYGFSFAGSHPVTDAVKALYRLEYATQSDHGSSRLDYRADYYTAELGAATKTVSLLAAYEVLGSDDARAGSGFKTPLATLHAHNGWADKFLATPSTGLADLNLKTVVNLPADLTLLARYHWFADDQNSADYGRELDLQLTYKFDAHLSFAGKAAFYSADPGGSLPGLPAAVRQDTDKVWLQADYAY